MPINGFLPFATGNGANVLTDQAYAASPEINQGVQDGPADPQSANKTWRQGSVMASAIGQFIADFAQVDTNDSQAISVLENNFRAATAAALDGARMGFDTSATPNSITFPLTPLPPTLAGLKIVYFKPANTNTGVSTAQVLKSDGTAAFSGGTTPIKRRDGADVQAGDLVAGVWYGSVWDGATAKLIGITKSEITALGTGSGSLLNVQVLTTSGTYIPTPGTKRIRVTATAGGGAGGGAGTPSSGVGDGAEGGTTAIAIINMTGVTSVSYTVGAGGAPSALNAPAATRGGTGGATTFGSYISVPGGMGGLNQANTGSSAGGTTGGTLGNGAVGVIIPGNPGSKTASANTTGYGGLGGASFWGGAGYSVDSNSATGSNVATPGAPATGYGSGGGGADTGNTGTSVQGGAGGPGVIFVEEFA